MKSEFSTFDICRIFGIKRHRLKDWMMRGYVTPSIQRATGQGTKSLFSRKDLHQIAVFMKLIDFGISRKHALRLMREQVQIVLAVDIDQVNREVDEMIKEDQ